LYCGKKDIVQTKQSLQFFSTIAALSQIHKKMVCMSVFTVTGSD